MAAFSLTKPQTTVFQFNILNIFCNVDYWFRSKSCWKRMESIWIIHNVVNTCIVTVLFWFKPIYCNCTLQLATGGVLILINQPLSLHTDTYMLTHAQTHNTQAAPLWATSSATTQVMWLLLSNAHPLQWLSCAFPVAFLETVRGRELAESGGV